MENNMDIRIETRTRVYIVSNEKIEYQDVMIDDDGYKYLVGEPSSDGIEEISIDESILSNFSDLELKCELENRTKLKLNNNIKKLLDKYGFKTSLSLKIKNYTELEKYQELIGTRGCNDNFYKDSIRYNKIYVLPELDFIVKNSIDLSKDLESHLDSIQKLTKYNKYRLKYKQVEPEFKQIN